ncbi:replication initiation protein, partial [Cetobacterium sp.]|uniref:replication initiation protein n=1 Tax=Cetobacterium sp. TaxID=2071632 RepID=UPI003F2FAE1B
MQTKKLYKRNELIQIAPVDSSQQLSLSTHLAYNLILEKAHKFYNDPDRKSDVFEIGFLELTDYSGVTNNQFKVKLKENLLNLLSTKVYTYDNKYIKTYFNLLSQFEIKNNFIKLALPPILIENLLKNNYYTCLNLIELQNFKSKYTVIIFEMLKRYNNNIPKLEISKLKKILSYPETYNNFDIKRRVLEQIKKELFQKNNIVLDWKIEKIGTTWKSIKFSALQLTEAIEKKELSEKLVKAIEKARKNRFVDLVYSQKAMDKIITKYEEVDVIKGLNELYKYNSEIKNFSKILISKIDDIKNSKIELIKTKVRIKV